MARVERCAHCGGAVLTPEQGAAGKAEPILSASGIEGMDTSEIRIYRERGHGGRRWVILEWKERSGV